MFSLILYDIYIAGYGIWLSTVHYYYNIESVGIMIMCNFIDTFCR